MSRENLLGRLAVQTGRITVRQLEQCLREQESRAARGEPRPRLGVLLVQRGFLAAPALDELLAAQAAEPEPPAAATPEEAAAERSFGLKVVARGLATAVEVEESLLVQAALREHGIDLHLGEILVSRGVLTKDQVRALLARGDTSVRVAAIFRYPVAGDPGSPGPAGAAPPGP